MNRALTAVLVCALPFSAHAQSSHPTNRSSTHVGFQVGPSAQRDAAILDFRAPSTECGTTSAYARKGGPLTVTRSSTQTYMCGGVLQTGPANTIAVSQDGGAQIYGAGGNYATYSDQLNQASWTKVGEGVYPPSVVANAGVAPDGTTTAEQVSFPGHTITQFSVVSKKTGDGLPGCTSIWAKLVSGSSTFSICNTEGGTDGCNYTTITTQWTRVYACSSTAGSFSQFGSFYRANDAQVVLLWGAQRSIVYPEVSPYQPTSGTAVTWPETVVRTNNAIPLPGGFCAMVDATTSNWARTMTVLSGGEHLAPNSFSIDGTVSALYFHTYDSGGDIRVTQFATPAPGRHVITACRDGTTLTVRVDGAAVSHSTTGVGTGNFSAPVSPLYVGHSSSNIHFNGEIARAKVCASKDWERCQ